MISNDLEISQFKRGVVFIFQGVPILADGHYFDEEIDGYMVKAYCYLPMSKRLSPTLISLDCLREQGVVFMDTIDPSNDKHLTEFCKLRRNLYLLSKMEDC